MTTINEQENVTTQAINILKLRSDKEANHCPDVLAVEEPLEISLAWQPGDKKTSRTISVTMRTPGQDELLAAGFLFTEGIIRQYEDITGISCENVTGNHTRVILKKGVEPLLNHTERNFYTSSSCGVCGKGSIAAIQTVSPFSKPELTPIIDADTLYRLPQQLRRHQETFNQTGGLHAAGLFTYTGELIRMQEDVGRHNALDKLIGWSLVENILPLRNHILLLSGRASFELVQKATMAGIAIVAAIGAPSSLAVQLASESNITLAGFLKDNGCNVYSHAKRIRLPEKEYL